MGSCSTLVLLASEKGQGVHTLEELDAGSRILDFSGPLVGRDYVQKVFERRGHDGFLQVAESLYMGVSGGFDDYVNHSCEPNCGISFSEETPCLIALENIEAGSELTFDYASTQERFPFRFDCSCGAPNCRGSIGDFSELPERLRLHYLALGVVPPYLKRAYSTNLRVLRPPKSSQPMEPVFARRAQK